MTYFSQLGLSPKTLETLKNLGFEKPTPIQEKSIPLVLEGNDLIGLAQTGTGKTAAFGLPLIEQLNAERRKPERKEIRSLILAPTRELVNQIAKSLKDFVRGTPLRVSIVVGGASINRQCEILGRGTDILVATPGRLLDLANRNAINLTATRYLVLDEADQMLDLGFIHDLKKIVKLVPKRRQTMLFSATMAKNISDLAADYLNEPVRIEVTPPGKTADKVAQYVHFVSGKDEKTQILRDALNENPSARSIVFLRTKHTAERLYKHLETIGFSAASIHGNKSQGQRERALKAFRDGKVNVLVATDVAARGIDIPHVSHVYNYDLPEVPDAYVHRIGRTARAGREGIAVAFCAPADTSLLYGIEKLTGMPLEVASGERPEGPALGRGAPAGRKRGHGRGRPSGGPKGASRHRGQHANGGQGKGEHKNDNRRSSKPKSAKRAPRKTADAR